MSRCLQNEANGETIDRLEVFKSKAGPRPKKDVLVREGDDLVLEQQPSSLTSRIVRGRLGYIAKRLTLRLPRCPAGKDDILQKREARKGRRLGSKAIMARSGSSPW